MKTIFSCSVINKLSIVLLLLLISATNLALHAQENGLQIKIGGEIIKNNFRWSIAGTQNGTNPNILSELIFNPVNSRGFYGDVRYTFFEKISIKTSYNRSLIYKGTVTDFDYDGDNRTDTVKGDYLNSNKGYTQGFSIGADYKFLDHEIIDLYGGAAYNGSREFLYLINNVNNVRSTYFTRWRGASVSLDSKIKVIKNFYFRPGIQCLILNYYGEGNWSTRGDFMSPKSFTHHDVAYGLDFKLFANYNIGSRFSVELGHTISNWSAHKGTDILYRKDGAIPVTQLNEVVRKMRSWRLGIGYLF